MHQNHLCYKTLLNILSLQNYTHPRYIIAKVLCLPTIGKASFTQTGNLFFKNKFLSFHEIYPQQNVKPEQQRPV